MAGSWAVFRRFSKNNNEFYNIQQLQYLKINMKWSDLYISENIDEIRF